MRGGFKRGFRDLEGGYEFFDLGAMFHGGGKAGGIEELPCFGCGLTCAICCLCGGECLGIGFVELGSECGDVGGRNGCIRGG